ncbi:MAG: LysM peptidoglycan-binding domain-containing protein [Reyranellales bacterium]
MSRTIFGFVAVGVVVIAIALAVAWRGKVSDQAVIAHAAKPVASAPAMAPAAPGGSQGPAVGSAPAAAVMAPSFDVARIDPDGRAVIAGRASPGAKIVLLDGGKEIARGEADARGEWVLLAQDPPLGPGQHELRVVQHIEGRAPVTSDQVVVAVVPVPPDAKGETSKDQTLVMIAPPGGAATLVQPPTAAGVPKSGDLQLSTLDYDERGHVTVTGQATAGATVRVYIDDKLASEGAAGADGHWRLVPAEPIENGKHKLRLDRLAKDGKPLARLEMSFERLVAATPAAADNRRLNVVRGDNLWNIARAHYGEGWRYTVIFEANKNQIRDPDLIYPGQIFSLPKIN